MGACSEEIKRARVTDQKAETTQELADATGESYSWCRHYAQTQVTQEVWEVVNKKRKDGKVVKAFRRISA